MNLDSELIGKLASLNLSPDQLSGVVELLSTYRLTPKADRSERNRRYYEKRKSRGGEEVEIKTFKTPLRRIKTGVASENANSPVVTKGVRMTEPTFPEGYPSGHVAPLTEWFLYKLERRKGYTPRGWNALLKEHANQDSESLARDVQWSMSKPYDGIHPAKGRYKDATEFDIMPSWEVRS